MSLPVEDEAADFIAGCVACGVYPEDAAEVEVITRFMADATIAGQIGFGHGLALTYWAAEWIRTRQKKAGESS